jgi:hypothetical protein
MTCPEGLRPLFERLHPEYVMSVAEAELLRAYVVISPGRLTQRRNMFEAVNKIDGTSIIDSRVRVERWSRFVKLNQRALCEIFSAIDARRDQSPGGPVLTDRCATRQFAG